MNDRSTVGWHRAMVLLEQHGVQFSAPERYSGWPQYLTGSCLAILQSGESDGLPVFCSILFEDGHIGSVPKNRPLSTAQQDFAAWCEAIGDACLSGKLQSIDQPCDSLIKALDFAAWLATQRGEPSVHIQSWLDAYKTEPEQTTAHIHPQRRARDSLTSVFDEAARQAGGDRAKMRTILADQKHPQADKIKRLSQNALTKRISTALKPI